ncbi:MAG: phosphatase PAP2 family protein [Paracoccaceae bacterium]
MKNLPVMRFAALGFVVSMTSFMFLDEIVYHLTLATEDDMRVFWDRVTDLGDSAWMGVATISAWVLAMLLTRFYPQNPRWKQHARQSIFVFAAVAMPGVAAMIIKGFIGRARPYLYDEIGPFGFDPLSFQSTYASWPSGHTTTAFAFAIALSLLFSRAKYILLPLAFLAGYSRMALGAHYLADVIMGATIGTIGAILVYRWLAQKLKI